MLSKDKDFTPEASAPSHNRGALLTFLLFLLGNKTAISRLASTPHLWVIGLLLTISAGLAREYDAEYLFAEPWHIFIAPGASFIAATVLWLVVQISGCRLWKNGDPTDAQIETNKKGAMWAPQSFIPFLGLFWMTAPLAWIYGIPYEMYVDSVTAARYNINSLLIVAAWRVFIMIRVLQVIFGLHPIKAIIIVLFFGDAVVFVASQLWEQPVFVIMGGLRLDGAEAIFAHAKFIGQVLSFLALFPLLIAWLSLFGFRNEKWEFRVSGPAVKKYPFIIVGSMATCVWLIALIWTQPEQKRRWDIEQAFKENRISDAISLLDQYYPHQLPAHWDPPPQFSYGKKSPEPLVVLSYIKDRPATDPIRAIYERKLLQRYFTIQNNIPLLLDILEESPPENHVLTRTHEFDHVRNALKNVSQNDDDPELRKRAQALLDRYPEPQ